MLICEHFLFIPDVRHLVCPALLSHRMSKPDFREYGLGGGSKNHTMRRNMVPVEIL